MTPERWQQVKAIFLSALEREPQERALFLAQACSDDPQLKSEVEALISSHQQAGGSLETMVMDVAAQMLNGQQTAPTVAQKVGPYELVKKIGAGGMGEVYLARDNRLARQVALKLLPAHVGQDKQRLDRFKQEARTASALNHPNILTIYEIGEEAGRPFIATELIEGETLRERIAAARLPLNDALEVAVQVATGLSAAHEAGIVHRDIKPENLMLRHDGYVKILDFGLAKLINPHADGVEISTQVKTNEGVVMGTPRYMSPEQARGQQMDGRTDIFSLGTVLYEMLSGRAPFAGATPGDLIVAILEREEPPVSHYAEGIPAELDGVVRKALCKEREERYQTAKELLSDLKAIKHRLEFEAELERSAQPREENRSPVAVGARQAVRTADAEAQTTKRGEYAITESKRQKRNVLLIAGAVIVVAVAGYLVWHFQSRNEAALSPPRNAAFTQLTDQGGPEYFPSLAPDGKSFVYASYASGNWDIYFQRVGGKNAINLTKDAVADDTQPAFSPDGERITFRSERDGGGIFVMGATGESVKRLTDFGYNPAWSPDGKEIACAEENTVTNPVMRWSANNRVWTVSVSTGEKRLVMTEGTQPNWSPNGHRIALSGRLKPGGRRDIFTIPAGGGETIEVTTDPATDWNPVWSPDGKYLYFVSDRSGSMNLWRVPVEEHSGKVLGQPEAVTTPSPFSAHLSFSRDGKRVVYAQIVSRANFQQVGFDPRREKLMGQPAWITQSSRWANTPDLSPDGEWLAFDSQGGQPEDLFVVRRDGTSLRQLTDDAHRDRRPNWSPDGKQIVFFSNRSGKWEIWMINSDGSGLQQLTDTPKEVTNAVWSPDGTRLVYRNYGSSPSIIEVGKPWPEQSPEVLPSMKDLSDWFPWSWSPDGRKIAGFKMGAGGPEGISVFSLESRQLEKLTNFGLRPVWSSDSRRMLFQDLQARLYLLDSQSKKFREVLSGRPHDLGNGVALSRDDRLIYFSLVTTEADIWLMSLE